jgi:hypothetical protein
MLTGKSTVPAGVIVPLPAVSVTVAVHIVVCPSTTGLGEQPTLVEVERSATDNSAWLLPLLALCSESPL